MTVNKNFLSIKFAITVFFIGFFIFVIAYADKFSENKQELVINHSFVGINDVSTPEINLDDITSVQLNENNQGVIKYTVQAGDSLSRIASLFGSTVGHIKEVNHIT
jgi:LysM repeat protein